MTLISIEAASASSIQDIVLTIRRSITETCVLDHGNDPQKLANWLANKTEKEVMNWLNNPSLLIKVVMFGEQIAGVGMCTTAGEISLCYISPDYQHRGLGTAMITALEEDLYDNHAITRTVLVSTLTALKLYFRLGYEINGTIINCQGINGIPMRRSIQKPQIPTAR